MSSANPTMTGRSGSKFNKYRSRLLELNDRYIDDVQRLNANVLFSRKESGAIPSEWENDDALRELGLELISGESERIRQVQEAIRRIESGMYGLCADCGKPISEERLTALPYARQCIQCKIKHEKSI